MLTEKGECKKNDLRLRSRDEPSRSCCIWVDASMRGKGIGTAPSVLSLFYQNLEAETSLTSYDLEGPEGEFIGSRMHMSHRDWTNIRMS